MAATALVKKSPYMIEWMAQDAPLRKFTKVKKKRMTGRYFSL